MQENMIAMEEELPVCVTPRMAIEGGRKEQGLIIANFFQLETKKAEYNPSNDPRSYLRNL